MLKTLDWGAGKGSGTGGSVVQGVNSGRGWELRETAAASLEEGEI